MKIPNIFRNLTKRITTRLLLFAHAYAFVIEYPLHLNRCLPHLSHPLCSRAALSPPTSLSLSVVTMIDIPFTLSRSVGLRDVLCCVLVGGVWRRCIADANWFEMERTMEGQTPKARWIKMVNGDGWLDGTSTDWISRRIITDRSSGRLSCASTCGFYYSELALDNAAFSND